MPVLGSKDPNIETVISSCPFFYVVHDLTFLTIGWLCFAGIPPVKIWFSCIHFFSSFPIFCYFIQYVWATMHIQIRPIHICKETHTGHSIIFLNLLLLYCILKRCKIFDLSKKLLCIWKFQPGKHSGKSLIIYWYSHFQGYSESQTVSLSNFFNLDKSQEHPNS